MAGFFNPHQFETGRSKSPQRITQCGRCGLFSKCVSPKMGVGGDGRHSILFVGEAPTRDDDNMGIHFSDEGGDLLRGVLDDMDVDMEDCSMAYSVQCRPKKDFVEPFMVSSCRPALTKAINTLKPNVIVLLGPSALDAVLSVEWPKELGGMNKWVGYTIPSPTYNAWICPVYHPSFILKNKKDPVLMRIWEDQIRRAVELENVPPEYCDVNELRERVELLSPKKAYGMLKWLNKQSGIMAFDYECTGLKPEMEHHQIVSCSISFEGRCWAFMMHPKLRKILGTVLRNPNLKKVASNLKYEERWSVARIGTKVRGWHWDTMLSAHYLDNRPGICSVKFQAYVMFGVGDYDSHISPYLKAKSSNGLNNIHQIDEKELLIYNGIDSILEEMVMERQKEEFHEAL